MGDNQDPQTQPDPEPQNGGDPDPEKGFWDKMTKLVDDRLDAGIERGIKKHMGTRNQRTGRTSLPGMIANFVFPEPPQQQR